MKRIFVTVLTLLSTSTLAILPGELAPNFTLKNQEGKSVSLNDYKGKYVVLEWYNEGCPFVRKHYDAKNMQMVQDKSQKEKIKETVTWLTINSSAKGKQGHISDPKAAFETIKRENMLASHLLLDSDGKVGRIFEAKTTPHMYIINPMGKLVYNGAIDSNSSPSQAVIPSSKNYIISAIMDIKEGRKIASAKTKPYGCSVKY